MDLKKKGVSSVEIIVRFGIPFERIIEHLEESDVNLIVVGSGEGEKKFLLGITAERVMTYADKPVLAVKPGSHPLIKKIFCPVDFKEWRLPIGIWARKKRRKDVRKWPYIFANTSGKMRLVIQHKME
jgi:hypothetical protein